MKYNKTFREALKEVSKLKEDGHTDVASAIRKCKTAIEDASQLLSKLQGMDPEGGLPSWWNSKLAIAANSMNKLRDYLLVPSITREDFDDINRLRRSQGGQQHVGMKRDDPEKSKETIQDLKNQIQMLKLELENEKKQLLIYLRENLKNNELYMEINVDESVQEKLVYTDKDKYELMKKKNPDIEILKDSFNLSI